MKPITALFWFAFLLPAACSPVDGPSPESQPQSQLLIHPESISPVLDGNSNILAVPGPEGRSDLWVMTDQPYRLRAIGLDEIPGELNQPNYPYHEEFENVPLYGEPEPLGVDLPPGFYNLIPRPDGLFDLVHGGSLTYFVHTGSLETPAFEKSYRVSIDMPREELEALRVFRHGEKFVGDINGNGLPDLMILHFDERRHRNPWQTRPAGIRPWEMEDDPRIGPSTDYQNVGPFRVNDVEGVPTAKTVTLELLWAPGRRDAEGQLAFEALRPVFLGHTDYPAVWEQFQNFGKARFLQTGQGDYIVLMEKMGRMIALPVLHADEEMVRVGKAVPLLADGPFLSGLLMAGGTTGFVDINGDGRKEFLIRGGPFGGVTVLAGERPGHYKEAAVLRRQGAGAPVVGIELSMTERVDLDGDGLEDILVGTAAGSLFIYLGTEDPLVYRGPYFARTPEGFLHLLRAREHDNLQGPQERGWGYLNAHAADFTGDGRIDLLVNDNTSYPQLLRATGEPLGFASPQPFTYHGKILPVQWRTKVVTLDREYDFAGSGRTCIVFIDLDRGLSVGIPKEQGSTEIEEIIPLTTESGDPLVLCGFNGQSGRTKIQLHDWNGNGRLDLVFGTAGGLLPFFDPDLPYDNVQFRQKFGFRQQAQPYVWFNTGSNARPVFSEEGPRRIGVNRAGAHLDPDLFRVGYHCFSIHATNFSEEQEEPSFIAADEDGYIHVFLPGHYRLAE